MKMDDKKKFVPQIKICGITKKEELEWLIEEKVDMAGFVLFYPKSKRNIDLNLAQSLVSIPSPGLKKVAVVVSPTMDQVNIIANLGFDLIQIHGEVEAEIQHACSLPIIRGIQVIGKDQLHETMEGYSLLLYDAKAPGSGTSFDWSVIPKKEERERPVILAGGLNLNNVNEAINEVYPDCVDVSSGVELENGIGKDKEKIKKFVRMVRYGK